MGHWDHMYAFSSKSGSEPFRALGDLTWNDPVAFLYPITIQYNEIQLITTLVLITVQLVH